MVLTARTALVEPVREVVLVAPRAQPCDALAPPITNVFPGRSARDPTTLEETPVTPPADHFPRDTAGVPASRPTETIDVPDGGRVELRVAPATKRIGDATVRMLAYNGSIPGPTLQVAQGSEATIVFEAFIAAGVMQAPDTTETVSRLAQDCLILGDSWFPFEELDGQPLEPGDLERGVPLIIDVFRPYFSDSAVAELEAASISS
jgi:hypothetical protein